MITILALVHVFLLGIIVGTVYLIFAEPGVDDDSVRTVRRNDGTAIAQVLIQTKSVPAHLRS